MIVVIEKEMKMESKKLRQRDSPVIAFNAAKSKLGKLPQLVKYVASNCVNTDFFVELELPDDFSDSNLRVLKCFSDLPREKRLEQFQRFALYCFMRFSTFGISEKPREDIESNGIIVKLR
jgi:hypothetical protein